MRSPEALRAVAMRFFDTFNAHDLDGLDLDIIGAEYVQHSPGVPPTRAALIAYLDKTIKAFDDGRFVVDDMLAEGDKVLIRWTFLGTHTGYYGGMAPTGRVITITGMDLWRYNDADKIAEAWFYMDMSGVRAPAPAKQAHPHLQGAAV